MSPAKANQWLNTGLCIAMTVMKLPGPLLLSGPVKVTDMRELCPQRHIPWKPVLDSADPSLGKSLKDTTLSTMLNEHRNINAIYVYLFLFYTVVIRYYSQLRTHELTLAMFRGPYGMFRMDWSLVGFEQGKHLTHCTIFLVPSMLI